MGDINSEMALKPFPPGSFEVLKSNQIWETVVEYVTDSSDWSNLNKTCTTFHDLVAEKATLTEVLKIMKREGYLQSIRVLVSTEHDNGNAQASALIQNVGLDHNYAPAPDRDENMQLLPRVYGQRRNLHRALRRRRRRVMGRGYWTWTPLHLRLVSKTWKIATEEAFMNEFSGQWQFDLSRFANENCKYTKFRYRSDVDLERAHQILRSSDRVAPLVQILEILKFCDESSDGFSTKFFEFLDEYGSSVKGLIINWSSAKQCSPSRRYERLLSLVMRMPYLKLVMIQNDNVSSRDASSSSESEKIDLDFQSIIGLRPFPKVRNLEAFSVKEGYVEENIILKEIFSKARNLKSVRIPTLIKDENVESLIETLGQLRIVCFQQNDCLFPDDLLKNVSWPLKELHAKSCCISSLDFGIVNRFADTLECLEVGTVQMELYSTPLQLPYLRKLYLGGLVKECFTGLDFLIPLESLEDLSFVCPYSFLKRSTSNMKKYLIDVYEYVEKMDESNIWRFFPNLNRLYIEREILGTPRNTFSRIADEYRKLDEGEGFVKKIK